MPLYVIDRMGTLCYIAAQMFSAPHIKLYDLPQYPCMLVPNRVNISLLHMIEAHCEQTGGVCWLADRDQMPSSDITDYLSSRQAEGIIFSSSSTPLIEVKRKIIKVVRREANVVYLPSTPSKDEPAGDPLTDVSAETLAFFTQMRLDIHPLYLGLYNYDEQHLIATRLPCDHMLAMGLERVRAGKDMAQRLRDAWQEASMRQCDELHQLEDANIGLLILESLLTHSKASVIDGVNDSLISYDELLSQLVPLARELRSTYSQCYRIGIILPPGRDAILANLACLITGIVPVNIDTTLDRVKVETIIREAELTRFITEERYYQKPSTFAWPLTRDLIMLGDLLGRIGSWQRRVWLTTAHIASPSRLYSLLLPLESAADDEAMLFYSCDEQQQLYAHSITHRMLLASRYISQARLPLEVGHTILSTQPYYMPMGFIMGLLYPLLCGCDIVTYPIVSALPRFLTLGKQYKVDAALTHAAQLRQMLTEKPPVPRIPVSMTFISYGEQLPVELQAHYEQHWGMRFMHAYYCPESASLLTLEAYSRGVDELLAGEGDEVFGEAIKRCLPETQRARLSGYPLLGTALRICDPESAEPLEHCPHKLGMLWVRSSSLISGRAWLRTGQIACMSEDGELCIAGREHRFSKLQHELVSHELIEELICGIFDVKTREPRRMAVLSVRSGEDISEKIVLLSSIHKRVSSNELLNLCYKLMNQGYPACWCPSHILPIDTIPECGNGELDYTRAMEYACERLGLPLPAFLS